MQLLAVALARRDGLPADGVVVGALPDWLIDEPAAPVRAAAEVALRRALLPEHPLAFVEPVLGREAAATWHAIVAALLPDAGDVEAVLRAPGDVPATVAQTRAAADVAVWLRSGRERAQLAGPAAEHAARAIAAAGQTLAALEDSGWRAVVDQPLAVGARGLGAEAVAERTAAFDPLAVEVLGAPRG
jgi:hypothetical protein